LRQEDFGLLWEQCVLNELHGYLQKHVINYWRDKSGHEIDFVVRDREDNSLAAIECKFTGTSLSLERSTSSLSANFEAFRKHYPHGKNYIVANDIDTQFERRYGETTIAFVNPKILVADLL